MIKETLGLDTRPYEAGLQRAQGATMNYMGRARLAFAQFGAAMTLAFGIRALKSLTDFAEQLKDVNSEASKSAKAFRDIATEQDISRVARMGKELDNIWVKMKLISIHTVAGVVDSLRKTKAITVGPERDQAIEQLQAEGQLRADDPTRKIGLWTRFRNTAAQNAAADRAEALIRERAGKIFDTQEGRPDMEAAEERERLKLAAERIEIEKRADEQWKRTNDQKKDAIETQKRANESELDAEEKKLAMAQDRKLTEMEIARVKEMAAGKQLDLIDTARSTLGELAEGGSGISGMAKQGARRVQGLERRAKSASSRGNDAEALRLINQANAMRDTIPGLKSSEKGFGKTDSEKLADISLSIKAVAAKFGVAGGGGGSTGGSK